MEQTSYTLGELADRLGLECRGDRRLTITGLAPLASAGSQQLAFLANPRYSSELENTAAGAVILASDMFDNCSCAALLSDQPYLSYAKASQLFDDSTAAVTGGIHASAVVSSTATIAASATVSANCVIADNVQIGEGTIIGPGCTIGRDSVIGSGGLLHANVSIYHRVTIGDNVIIHSATVIGSDGFGFAPSAEGWVKIAQLGGVRIGNDVEIGAAVTIDRGALDDTVLGNNIILDNQVLIAHNVEIGDHTAMAGDAGISGSTKIGKRCLIAGGVGFVGHITVADDVQVTGRTIVTKSITKAGSYSSGTGMQETSVWRKNVVRFAKLDEMYKRVRKLEKALLDSD